MTTTCQRESLFSVDTVVRYLYTLKPNISPVKLQKTLYFLFAYYCAVYGQHSEDGRFEGTAEMPRWLFDAQFEAWHYGPVIREVWVKNQHQEYNISPQMTQQALATIESRPEIKQFVDELFEQIDSVSDFTLVDRSREDDSWKRSYRDSKVLNNDLIAKEYIEKYIAQA